MADTAKQTKVKKAPTKAPKDVKSAPAKKAKSGRARNYQLPNGVWRFSRSRMYHKTAQYRFIKRDDKGKPVKAGPQPKRARTPRYVEKPIGGDKNGGKRLVRVKKLPKVYQVEPKRKLRRTTTKQPFYKHKRNLRSSITPGTVLIVVAGRHRGKRVVFLKQLKSGLLLVNGPFKINRCPLRRIHQNYVIATRTKLDISKIDLPKHLGDKYFRRVHENRKKTAKTTDVILKKKKKSYKVSAQRKKDQKIVDKQLHEVIKVHPDRKLLIRYLSSVFALKNKMFPHKMRF